jgi:hypothetical protein
MRTKANEATGRPAQRAGPVTSAQLVKFGASAGAANGMAASA